MDGRGGLAIGVAALGGVVLAVWLGWPSAPLGEVASPVLGRAPSAPLPSAERSRDRTASMPASRAEVSSTRGLRTVGDLKPAASPVDAVVRPRLEDLRACHAAARAHDAATTTTFTLVLDVNPTGGGDGQISRVTSTLGPSFDACSARLLKGGRLPATEPTTIRYPLTF